MIWVGIQLRALSRRRAGLAVSFVLAALVAVCATEFRVSLLPPGLATHSPSASARTQVLVDSPQPGVLGAGYGSAPFTDLQNGALLVASMAVSEPVRAEISQRARVPMSAIEFSSPQAPPGASIPQPERRTTGAYTVTVAARPVMPIVDVVSQAPTQPEAVRLANATATSLRAYLASGATGFALRVTQLGTGTVDRGSTSSPVTPFAVFLAVFGACCAAMLAVSRRKSPTAPRVGPVAHASELGLSPWH
jgi:hypothetical protein